MAHTKVSENKKMLGYVLKKLKINVPFSLPSVIVDEENSRCFCPSFSSFGIYVNDKVRYEDLVKVILEELKSLRDLHTGKKIIQNVYRKEELYDGPLISQAPDIVFVPSDGVAIRTELSRGRFVDEENCKCGCHSLNGIFIAYGPHIKESQRAYNLRIVDIAPTILHLFGVPIPRATDGRVLKEIFKENSEPANRPVNYQEKEEESIKNIRKVKENIRKLKDRKL